VRLEDLHHLLHDSAAEVFETMIFACVGEEAEMSGEAASAAVSARLRFHGDLSGRFGVRMSRDTARKVAASFLGEEEDAVSGEQVGEVVCEVTNMVCGSMLSRLEGGGRFHLQPPELAPWERAADAAGWNVCHTYGLEEGSLTAWLELDPPR
jgi:CheY-specific phosphatase CheX